MSDIERIISDTKMVGQYYLGALLHPCNHPDANIDELIEGNHGLVVACDLSSRSTYLYHESQATRLWSCHMKTRSYTVHQVGVKDRPRALSTLKEVIERLQINLPIPPVNSDFQRLNDYGQGYQWDSFIFHTRKDLCATIYIYRGLTPDMDDLPFLTVKWEDR